MIQCEYTHTHTHLFSPWVGSDPNPCHRNSPSGMLNVFCCFLPESRRKLHFFSVSLIWTVADLKRIPGNGKTLNLSWKREDEKNLFSTKIKESERTVYIIRLKLCFILKFPSAVSAYIQHAGFQHGPHSHCEWMPAEGGVWTFDSRETTKLPKVTPWWQVMA